MPALPWGLSEAADREVPITASRPIPSHHRGALLFLITIMLYNALHKVKKKLCIFSSGQTSRIQYVDLRPACP